MKVASLVSRIGSGKGKIKYVFGITLDYSANAKINIHFNRYCIIKKLVFKRKGVSQRKKESMTDI